MSHLALRFQPCTPFITLHTLHPSYTSQETLWTWRTNHRQSFAYARRRAAAMQPYNIMTYMSATRTSARHKTPAAAPGTHTQQHPPAHKPGSIPRHTSPAKAPSTCARQQSA
mmetsp:Transcript_27327/g.59755  ORF Transcript_27327/g.59755 Transcript_27327/m.59755 type:complete len:112 (-) Transcript_27327:755-1090(-)